MEHYANHCVDPGADLGACLAWRAQADAPQMYELAHVRASVPPIGAGPFHDNSSCKHKEFSHGNYDDT
jgi:hypothetical protein